MVQTQYCDWDHDRQLIVAIWQRDPETGLPVDGQKGWTDVPFDPANNVESLPYINEYPEGFIERFPQLLGPGEATLNADSTAVVMSYPDADFSEAAVRAELKRMAREQARKILDVTDWYVVRQIETGTALPEDVAAMRQSVRSQIDDIETEIDATSGSSLITFEWTFLGVDPYLQGATR